MLFAAVFLLVLDRVAAQAGNCQSCIPGCTADACFQTLAGTEFFPPQPSVDDCRSYLWTHITVAETTHTATETATVEGTATETVYEQDTTTITVATTTATVFTTITTGTSTFGSSFNLKKRQNTIPADVSQCSNAAAYSSGCQCLGITTGGTLYFHIADTTIVTTVDVTNTVTESVTVTSSARTVTVETDTATTVTSIKPLATRFAIQATNDIANGMFRGQFLRSYLESTDPNPYRSVGFIQDPLAAGGWLANANGNITSTNGTPLMISREGEGPQIYNAAPPDDTNWLPVNCWLTADQLVQCQAEGRIALSATNSTGGLRIFGEFWRIRDTGSTGPLILKAVPFLDPAPVTPPAVAKEVVIRAQDVAQNGAYKNYYFGSTVEDVGGVSYIRMTYVQDVANAKRFLVDPFTGIIKSTTNEPFGRNTVTVAEQWYNFFPPPGNPHAALETPCYRRPAGNLICENALLQHLATLDGSEGDKLFIWNSTLPTGYSGPYYLNVIET